MKDPISERIIQTAYYAGMSYRSIAESAVEVESVTDPVDNSETAKERKTRLRREFKKENGLTSQVWARVPKRFDGNRVNGGEHAGLIIRDYVDLGEKQIRAASYLCQLPIDYFLDLYDAVQDNLDDYGGVLNQVNAVLDEMRLTRAITRPAKPKPAPTCERCERVRELLEKWDNLFSGSGYVGDGRAYANRLRAAMNGEAVTP
jgi:hypothetical protein